MCITNKQPPQAATTQRVPQYAHVSKWGALEARSVLLRPVTYASKTFVVVFSFTHIYIKSYQNMSVEIQQNTQTAKL